jgi:hypothetical protein
MTPILTRPRPAPPRSRGDVAAAVVAGVAGIALLLFVMPSLRLPSYVDAISVSNPHVWHVEIDVGRPDGSRWIGLGRVGREETQTFQSVIDPGDEWMFRFEYGGIGRGDVVVNRTELERAGWKLTVPEEFAERMRAAGESPSGE